MDKIVVYQTETDVNRYVGFCDTRRLLFADFFNEMCKGMSLESRWQPAKVDVVEGRLGDFVGGPVHFARIAVSNDALNRVLPLIKRCCELLPFSYEKKMYWALYVPWPSECLDIDATEYWSEGRNSIRRHVFIAEKVPTDGLFRLPGRFEYYCTQSFKDAVEADELTGLIFRFVWSSDGSVPQESKSKKRAETRNEPVVKAQRRPTKRDLLLERLWSAI